MCIDTPQFATLRDSRKDAPMAVSLSRAIAQAGRRLTRVLQAAGPHAIGLYMPPTVAPETLYVATKFAQGTLRGARLFQDFSKTISALDCSDVRALWMIHPSAADDCLQARRSLATTDLIIVQDDASPDSMPADLFFPSSRAPSTASEAKPDWWWIQQVALAMGFRAGLQFSSTQEIRDEMALVNWQSS